MPFIKRLIVLSIFVPASAFAHMVPYDTEPFMNAAQGDADKALSMAIFCKTLKLDKESCLIHTNGIDDEGVVEAMAKCGDSLKNYHSNFDDRFAHKVGSPGAPDRGFWHTGYVSAKGEGMHRHAWSAAAQRINKDEYVTKRLIDYKNSFSENSSSTTTSAGKSIGSTGSINGDAKFLGAGVGTSGSLNSGKSEETSKTNVKTGPSDAEMAAERKKAEQTFDESGVYVSPKDPDIYCAQTERTCNTPTGTIPNESYTPSRAEKPSTPKEENKPDTGPKKDSKKTPESADNDTGPDFPDTPHPNIYAGDPKPNKPGEMYANYSQDDIGQTGAEACMRREYEARRQASFSTHYNEDGKESKEQKFIRAKERLKLGFCDAVTLGNEFCREFNFKKNSHWTQDADKQAEEEKDAEAYKYKLLSNCPGGIIQGGRCISIHSQEDMEKEAGNASLSSLEALMNGSAIDEPTESGLNKWDSSKKSPLGFPDEPPMSTPGVSPGRGKRLVFP